MKAALMPLSVLTLILVNFPGSLLLAQQDDQVQKVVKGYWEAKTWQERLPFVLNPDKVKPFMEDKYGKGPLPAIASITLGSVKRPAEGKNWVIAPVTVMGRSVRTASFDMPVRLTKDGPKVDWEAAVCHNELTFRVFAATAGTEAVKFRVLCSLDTYYNFDYDGTSSTHFSIRLKQKDDFHGYLLKNSDNGERLLKILKDGKDHPLILELRRVGPTGQPIRDPGRNVAAITKIVSESWVDESPSKEEEAARAKAAAEARRRTAEEARGKQKEQARKDAIEKAPENLKNAKSLFDQGRTAYDKGNYREAAQLFEKAIEGCTSIVTSAPDTKEATQAKQMLTEVQKLLDSGKGEQEAARKLKLAKMLAADGLTDKARARLKEITDKYPNTVAGKEAKALLEKLN